MEATSFSKGLRTITLDNGTVLTVTEDKFSAMMACVEAPRVREEAAADRLNKGSFQGSSAVTLDEGRFSTTLSQARPPRHSCISAIASSHAGSMMTGPGVPPDGSFLPTINPRHLAQNQLLQFESFSGIPTIATTDLQLPSERYVRIITILTLSSGAYGILGLLELPEL